MYLEKSPFIVALIGFLFAAILFMTGCEDSSVDDTAVEATKSATAEAATSAELVEVTTEIAMPAPAV